MVARKNARERRRLASLPRVRLFFLVPIYFLAPATQARSLYVSGKLPTYPSPKSSLTLTFHLGQNVGSGEGWACVAWCFWLGVQTSQGGVSETVRRLGGSVVRPTKLPCYADCGGGGRWKISQKRIMNCKFRLQYARWPLKRSFKHLYQFQSSRSQWGEFVTSCLPHWISQCDSMQSFNVRFIIYMCLSTVTPQFSPSTYQLALWAV